MKEKPNKGLAIMKVKMERGERNLLRQSKCIAEKSLQETDYFANNIQTHSASDGTKIKIHKKPNKTKNETT